MLFDPQCQKCTTGIWKHRRGAVYGEGCAKADIMFIGEAPGAVEDAQGRPFVGPAGKVFDKLLTDARLNRRDVYVTNIVKCRPVDVPTGRNRAPVKEEINTCSDYLSMELSMIKPKLICPMGASALEYFLPKKMISQVHGKMFSRFDSEFKAIKVMPLYHPAVVIYRASMRPVLVGDMKKVFKYIYGKQEI